MERTDDCWEEEGLAEWAGESWAGLVEWTGDGCEGREWAGDSLEGAVGWVDDCSSEVWFWSGVGEAEIIIGSPAVTSAPSAATDAHSWTAGVVEGCDGAGLSPPLPVSASSCRNNCGGGREEEGWEAV